MEGPGGNFSSRSLITGKSSIFPEETNRYSLTNWAVLFHTSGQVALPERKNKSGNSKIHFKEKIVIIYKNQILVIDLLKILQHFLALFSLIILPLKSLNFSPLALQFILLPFFSTSKLPNKNVLDPFGFFLKKKNDPE